VWWRKGRASLYVRRWSTWTRWVEKMLRTVVAQKAYDSIVAQRDHVECIAEEEGYPIVARYEGPEDKLDNVEKHPDGEEGPYGDLFQAPVNATYTSPWKCPQPHSHQNNTQTPAHPPPRPRASETTPPAASSPATPGSPAPTACPPEKTPP